SPIAIWEPLLVRTYLREGRAIAGPAARQRPASAAGGELFMRGVLANLVQANLKPLLPCVLASEPIPPAGATPGALQALLGQALAESELPGRRLLVESSSPYLAAEGLFSDAETAARVEGVARQFLDRLMADLRSCGATIVEIDGDQALF